MVLLGSAFDCNVLISINSQIESGTRWELFVILHKTKKGM